MVFDTLNSLQVDFTELDGEEVSRLNQLLSKT